MARKNKTTKELGQAAIAAAAGGTTRKKTTRKKSTKKTAKKTSRKSKDPLAELRHCTSTVKRAKQMIQEADMAGGKSLASKRR